MLRLALSHNAAYAAFFLLAVIELAIPMWAESAGRTPWHPRHIAERYGLFTIIVLGESVLSATVGVQTAIDLNTPFSDLGFVIVGGLLTLFMMWWIYFDLPNEELAQRVRAAFSERISGAFAWGYGHYVVFAAAAATGTGLVVEVDHVIGNTALTAVQSTFRVHGTCVGFPGVGVGTARPLQAVHLGAQLRRADHGGAHPPDELHVRAGAADRVDHGRGRRGRRGEQRHGVGQRSALSAT